MKGLILSLMLVIGFTSTQAHAGCAFTKLILENSEEDCVKSLKKRVQVEKILKNVKKS